MFTELMNFKVKSDGSTISMVSKRLADASLPFVILITGSKFGSWCNAEITIPVSSTYEDAVKLAYRTFLSM